MFTLEAVRAKHGDSLLLLYGKSRSPKLIMIDGGPSGVFGTVENPGPLRGRLSELKAGSSSSKALPITVLIVSHIDDDHIGGVLELTNELVTAKQDSEDPDFDVRSLWHNSFEDILGDAAGDLFGTVGGMAKAVAFGQVQAPAGLPQEEAAVVASVPQGRQLRDDAKFLGIRVNATAPIKGLVSSPETGPLSVGLGDGLTLTVLGPKLTRLRTLREKWAEEIQRLKDTGKLDEANAAAFGGDRSVYNLSSIIILAERGMKSMLLTGDGLCGDILDGLEFAGKMSASGTLHVNLLKLPHHGSRRNVSPDFFERITADHYLISADGRYDNPDRETLEILTAARKKVGAGPAEVHLTTLPNEQYRGKTAIADAFAFITAHAAEGNYILCSRPPGDFSVKIRLEL